MKQILSIFLAMTAIMLQAKDIKIDYTGVVMPFVFKIEKMNVVDTETVITIKVKQRSNFSYSISFADCYVTIPSTNETVKGDLTSWNDDNKIYRKEQTISDQEDERFTLTFPTTILPECGPFDIKIGNILNKDKTPILFNGISAKKK